MFIAEVTFLGIDKGGRHRPPLPGFHPQIEAGDVFTSCIVEGLAGEVVFDFDRKYRVLLTLMFPEEYGGRLSVGGAARLFEGNRLIGEGWILDVKRS